VLFGSGWPRLNPGALPHAIVGVAGHLSDPRQGFPARLRPGLPGPTGFYLTLMLLAVILGLAAAGVIKLRRRAQLSGLGDPKRHGARWARAALLYAAARTGRGMGEVVRWVYGQGGAELDRIMHDLVEESRDGLERADAQQAHDAHLAFCQLAGETKGSIEGTAQILLSAYRSPTVVRSADGTDITGRRLLAGQHTVYLISDSRRSKLLRPILIALLTELLDDAYETANRSPGRRLPNPLLVCLDELGNAVPLPSLAEIASTAASHNIQLISIFHDIAHARTRYRDQALTVINNHRARLLLSGVGDIETLRYFSELLGEEEVKDRSDPGAPIRRRPLAPADQLRQIKSEHGLLIYGSLRPRHASPAPVLQGPQAQAGRATARSFVPTGAHADVLMTADAAVAG
jgi:TraM recognition site of TraD and TraG